MEEIRANKITPEEATGLMHRYMEPGNQALTEAGPIRERIAKGQVVMGLPDLTVEERIIARERMEALQLVLRKLEWTSTLALGLAMAHAVATTVSEAKVREAFRPPEGSLLRIQMPGICDVSVRLDQ